MISLNKLPMVLVLTSSLLLITFKLSAQNIGINSTGELPSYSAILDLSSTNKGFLITREEPSSISAPAFGLMTVAPSDSCLYMFSGENWMVLNGVGEKCEIGDNYDSGFPCDGTITAIIEVTSITGKIWMDRNLGATQKATISKDKLAYGSLYQWGRCSDGHEKRSSSLTAQHSSTDDPSHNKFIITSTAPYDWRTPQNDNLWQGTSRNNNPCPTNYRIPTEIELEEERLSWTTNDASGAFNSPLKLTVGGSRMRLDGKFSDVDAGGNYWSSNIEGQHAKFLLFFNGGAMITSYSRGDGRSIRCIRN